MPTTLYFINDEDEHVWKVPNCITEPALEDITVKSPPYALNWRLSNKSTSLKIAAAGPVQGGSPTTSSIDADIIHGGVVPKEGDAETWQPVAAETGKLRAAAGYKVAVPDDIAGRARRQDSILITVWKVQVSGGTAPEYMKIPALKYPGFSTQPPSWWVDPDA